MKLSYFSIYKKKHYQTDLKRGYDANDLIAFFQKTESWWRVW